MNNKLFFALITVFLCSGASVVAGERPGRLVKGTKRKIEYIEAAQKAIAQRVLIRYSDAFLVRTFIGKHTAFELLLLQQSQVVFDQPIFADCLQDNQRKDALEKELVTTHGFPRALACLPGSYLVLSDKGTEAGAIALRQATLQKYKALEALNKQLS